MCVCVCVCVCLCTCMYVCMCMFDAITSNHNNYANCRQLDGCGGDHELDWWLDGATGKQNMHIMHSN